MIKRFLLDCDPGIDDALALCALLGSRGLTLQGITTVFGNGTVRQATINAARVLQLLQHISRVPLAQGSSQPLTGSRLPRRSLHGKDGLGDIGIPEAQLPQPHLESTSFVCSLLKEQALDEIVALGPLTNLAHVFASAPRLLRGLRAVWIMGGVVAAGVDDKASEFNLASDPSAGECLLRSKAALRWIPLGVAARVRFSEQAVERFKKAHPESPVAATICELISFVHGRRGEGIGAVVPDAVATAIALKPSLGVWRQRRLSVEGRARTGRLRIEHGIPNAQVCESVKSDEVAAFLWDAWSHVAKT